MGKDKKITEGQAGPTPTPTTEEGTPFKAYGAPGAQASSDTDAEKD